MGWFESDKDKSARMMKESMARNALKDVKPAEAKPQPSSTVFQRRARQLDQPDPSQREVEGKRKGGSVKKPSKQKIMQAIMMAHQAGVQKGAQAAAQGAGGPPPPQPGTAPGMKKGGAVKKLPPWMKKDTDNDGMACGGKVKKMAAGGVCRGDGAASRGRTRGRIC
jgi:hypothetical protein